MARRTTATKASGRAAKAKAAKDRVQKAAVRRGKAKDKTKRPTRGADKFSHVTKEDIVKARDKDQLSWRAVAVRLDLGSPSAARRAYEELTGRSHKESIIASRAPRGTGSSSRSALRPEWNNRSNRDEIRSAVLDSLIGVERKDGGELGMIMVGGHVEFLDKTSSGKKMALTIAFRDRETRAARYIRVADIRTVN